MKKIAMISAGFLICGGVVLANQMGVKGLNFVAPSVSDRGSVVNEQEGEIIFETNTSGKTFLGRADGGWVNLGGSSSVLPPGMILAYGGATAPAGYLIADGRSINCSGVYSDLCNAIDKNFGDGTANADGTPSGCQLGECVNLPDLRGRFLRGVSGTTINDPDKNDRTAMLNGGNAGNSVGSLQQDQFKTHQHAMYRSFGSGLVQGLFGGSGLDTNNTGATIPPGPGGSETRPKNVNVTYIIKI